MKMHLLTSMLMVKARLPLPKQMKRINSLLMVTNFLSQTHRIQARISLQYMY